MVIDCGRTKKYLKNTSYNLRAGNFWCTPKVRQEQVENSFSRNCRVGKQ